MSLSKNQLAGLALAVHCERASDKERQQWQAAMSSEKALNDRERSLRTRHIRQQRVSLDPNEQMRRYAEWAIEHNTPHVHIWDGKITPTADSINRELRFLFYEHDIGLIGFEPGKNYKFT